MFPECAQNAGNLLPDHRASLPTWTNEMGCRRSSKGTATGKPQGKWQCWKWRNAWIFLAVYIHTYISLRLKRNLLNITIWNVLKEQISSLRQTSQRQEWTKHKDGRCWEHLKWDHAELFASHYQASGPGSWLGLPYILSLRMYGILAYHPQLRIPTSLGTRWLVIWILKGTSWDE